MTVFTHNEKTIKQYHPPKSDPTKPITASAIDHEPTEIDHIVQHTQQLQQHEGLLTKDNSNNKLSKTEIQVFNKELNNQQQLLNLHVLGQYRHVLYGTLRNKKENDININNRILVGKIKKSVHREMLQVPNNITTFDDDFIEQTIDNSRKICKLIVNLSSKSIKKFNKIIKNTNWKSLNYDQIEQKKNQIQLITYKCKNNHIFMETRAQKKKRLEKLQKQQQEERKEKTSEVSLWNQVEPKVSIFNDKIELQQNIYQALWGASDRIDITDLNIFRQCQRTDDWCQTIIDYLTKYEEFKNSIELIQLKKYQTLLHSKLVNNKFRINQHSELIEYMYH